MAKAKLVIKTPDAQRLEALLKQINAQLKAMRLLGKRR
jgi:hypothetical protein